MTDIAVLARKIDSLQEELDGLRQELSQLEAKGVKHEERLDALEGYDVEARLDHIESKVGALTAKTQIVGGKVDDIVSTVSRQANVLVALEHSFKQMSEKAYKTAAVSGISLGAGLGAGGSALYGIVEGIRFVASLLHQ